MVNAQRVIPAAALRIQGVTYAEERTFGIMPQNTFSKWQSLVRRFWLNKFRRKHVTNQLLKRKGDCHQCGRCCSLIFRCPFLTREGRCFIYHNGRPQQCRTFPIDKRDIAEVNGTCGYYFSHE